MACFRRRWLAELAPSLFEQRDDVGFRVHAQLGVQVRCTCVFTVFCDRNSSCLISARPSPPYQPHDPVSRAVRSYRAAWSSQRLMKPPRGPGIAQPVGQRQAFTRPSRRSRTSRSSDVTTHTSTKTMPAKGEPRERRLDPPAGRFATGGASHQDARQQRSPLDARARWRTAAGWESRSGSRCSPA